MVVHYSSYKLNLHWKLWYFIAVQYTATEGITWIFVKNWLLSINICHTCQLQIIQLTHRSICVLLLRCFFSGSWFQVDVQDRLDLPLQQFFIRKQMTRFLHSFIHHKRSNCFVINSVVKGEWVGPNLPANVHTPLVLRLAQNRFLLIYGWGYHVVYCDFLILTTAKQRKVFWSPIFFELENDVPDYIALLHHTKIRHISHYVYITLTLNLKTSQ